MNVDWWLGVAVGGIAATLINGWLTRRYFSKPVEVPKPPFEVRPLVGCPICPLSFSKRGLSNHVRKAHPESYRKESL